jgi:hypothetical protein
LTHFIKNELILELKQISRPPSAFFYIIKSNKNFNWAISGLKLETPDSLILKIEEVSNEPKAQ